MGTAVKFGRAMDEVTSYPGEWYMYMHNHTVELYTVEPVRYYIGVPSQWATVMQG